MDYPIDTKALSEFVATAQPNTEDVLWCQDPASDVNIAYVLAEKVVAALTTLEQSLRPDLFRTAEFHQAAMQIIEITREQLGIAPV